MDELISGYYSSPIGLIEISGTETGIIRICFTDERKPGAALQPACIQEAIRQLSEYFGQGRRSFNLDLLTEGTTFQEQVWQKVQQIPFGKTCSYKQLAEKLNSPNAVRAVGSSNARNRFAIVIPCHRVNSSNGQLTGYAWGLWRKQWLLQHEQSFLPQAQLRLFS